MPTQYKDPTMPLGDLKAEAATDLDYELGLLDPPMRRHRGLTFEVHGDRLVAVVFLARAPKSAVNYDHFAENVQWLLDQDVSPDRVARQLGVTYGAMLKRLQRAHRDDLVGRLPTKCPSYPSLIGVGA